MASLNIFCNATLDTPLRLVDNFIFFHRVLETLDVPLVVTITFHQLQSQTSASQKPLKSDL